MRWYISTNGETTGPHEEPEVKRLIDKGQITVASHVRDEAGSAWAPIGQSPFAGLLGMAPAGSSGSETLGTLLIAIPFFATLLIWFWIGQMNLFQNPSGSLVMVSLGTVGLTALLMATEASQLGMGRRQGSNGKPQSGPVTWFVAACLAWIIAFPWYLAARKHFGRRGLGIAGFLIGAIFTVSAFAMGTAIETKKAEIRRNLDSFRSGF